jgi:acyl carrier protein
MDTKRIIRGFILSNFLKEDKSIKLVDENSFLDAGIIDSVGILELVAFLEEKFQIEVEDEEIVPENFDSVIQLVAYVDSKSAHGKS